MVFRIFSMVLRAIILLHVKSLILRFLIAMKGQIAVEMMKTKMMTMTAMMMILVLNHH